MFYNTQEMMLRRKLEQDAELQQAMELQDRRLMNLQLMDLKNLRHGHQFQPGMLQGVAIPSSQPQCQINQDPVLPSDGINVEVPEGWPSSRVLSLFVICLDQLLFINKLLGLFYCRG